jgi:hypothetical protein
MKPSAAVQQHRAPAKRLHQGIAGSPLAKVIDITSGRSKPSAKELVLLHYCFDQQAGEMKREHCPCEERAERVTREVADSYVRDGFADWLVVKNVKAKSGKSEFHRAIVIRNVVIDGQKLFKVPSAWSPVSTDDRRTKKHEAIKRAILDRARNLLRKYFSKGWISQATSEMSDAGLEDLFASSTKVEEFFAVHNRPQMRKEIFGVVEHWWNNVLGYHRLNADACTFMPAAKRGKGKIVVAGDSEHIALIDGQHGPETDDEATNKSRTAIGRVAVANHRASFWCGGWDYSTGAAPKDSGEDATGQTENWSRAAKEMGFSDLRESRKQTVRAEFESTGCEEDLALDGEND